MTRTGAILGGFFLPFRHDLITSVRCTRYQLMLERILSKPIQNQRRTLMKQAFSRAAVVALILGALQAQSQSVSFTFADSTSDGWVNGGFSSSPASTVVPIGANNYIRIPLGGFQVANVNSGTVSGTPAATFNSAFFAALNNPSGYNVTYSYSIDTASFTTPGTYLQAGMFVNTGSGFYSQVYGSPNGVQLNGTQVASGSVFQGSVTVPMSLFGTDANAATENYFRLGIIENGDGTGVTVNFTGISITPVPEPCTLALAGLGGAALLISRRRK
jgi:hypothetical protein